ncbi:hypothetical protein DSN97_10260 [Deferribacteraceae bacterium V6Fe1]|nr:hypothetical protein DSN97_10260 [Deferribacteraceae bacterium V6Fe1]
MKKLTLTIFFTLITLTTAFASMQNYCSTPPFITSKIPPLVMLVMGKDHKLYYEAYNDASDLDRDGTLDIGYKHNLDYYGYFDSYKCYKYNSSGGYFYPVSTTADKYCTTGNNEWSGNFLNWMTMSRMDVLRKVLYGGYRSTDTTTETILEGTYIPQDAHSWGKEYTGTDSSKLTPYTDPSSGAVCTLPSNNATWDQNDKILLVYYDDDKSGVDGNNHDDLVNSYSVLDYSRHEYVDNINFASSNRINTGNYFFVTRLNVSSESAGSWEFAIDGDDGVEVEVDGTVVAAYYGGHGFCNCNNHNGSINLAAGVHTVIVRLRENTGEDGATLYFKNPKTSTTWREFTKDNLKQYKKNTLVAPYIDNTCRVKVTSFINTGIPGKAGDGNLDLDNDSIKETVGGASGGRNLFCMTSTSADTPHKIRVLTNRQNRIWEWASKERPVCDNSLGTPTEFYVRVKVCDETVGLEDNCKQYGSSYKPVGLLQKYGASDGSKVCTQSLSPCTNDASCGTGEGVCVEKSAIYFGLLTGSYGKNLSGGVVRKLFGPIDNELDITNGIIQSVSSTKGSIINTINNLNVRGFDYSNHTYSSCGWITDGPIDESDDCVMWGNPLAEIMYEAVRYMAGKGSPTSDYNVDDANLPEPTWDKPYDTYPVCSKPFIIAISDVNSSYDADQIPGSKYNTYSGDLTDFDVGSETASISTNESINGDYFIGVAGTNTDFLCSAKTVSTLAEVLGICPEEPTKGGSYYSAGVALYAKTKFSSNFDNSTTVPSEITTYSVALASPIPNIEIDTDNDGNTDVTLTPLGKSVSGCYGVYNSCAAKTTLSYDNSSGLTITNASTGAFCPTNQIVDVYLDYINPNEGQFSINFEDVEQGADHDMDAIVKYEYTVNDNGTITVTLNSNYASGCIDQAMGFSISGTTEDGVYLAVRDADSSISDEDTPSVVSDMPTSWSKTFTVNTSIAAAKNLKDPLWYVAKYGGFNDYNGDGLPSSDSEWDADGDGVPDKYFYVVNPLKLEQELDKVFKNILKETSSGTSISVLSERKKQGSIISQAVFYPSKDFDNTSLDWTGQLFSYWFYNTLTAQNIREDTNENKYLDVCSGSSYGVDNILDFQVNNAGDLQIDKYDSNCIDGTPDNKTGTIDKLDDIKYLWEAGEKLKQRSYDNRTIYTVADNNSALVEFTTTNSTEFVDYLGTATYTGSSTAFPKNISADDLIDYVRGNDISGCRNRDTGNGIWKLGDIVYSTPQITEYADYAMVFTGSNDGMLHAFRAGKISASGLGPYQVAKLCNSSGDCNFDELGKEEWAFIPKNALPYLRYLADPDYCHVYSVDLAPYIVELDTDNNDIIDKRILIGGMRFGGGVAGCTDTDDGEDTDDCVNPPKDTCSDLDADNCTGRSSYFALDITDPKSPKFLWEFTDKYLGFSYSGPAFIQRNGISYVMFLSGPTDYDGQAGQDLRMYVLTLDSNYKISAVNKFDGNGSGDWIKVNNFTDANNAFGGRLFTNGVDYNNDGNTDAVFFGINQKNGTSWQGNLYMLYINNDNPANWHVEKIFNNGTGVVTSKVEYMKCFDNDYIYFGTGRWFYKGDDMGQNVNDTEELYGVRVTGCLDDGNCSINSAKNTNDSCTELGSNNSVWAYKIDLDPKSGSYGKERLISDPAVTNDLNIVFYSTTEPSTNVCDFGGRSRIWGINCATGGSIFEGCPDGSYTPEEFNQTLYLQLSKGNIEDITKGTFNNGKTTDWYKGITPETPPILPPPYSGKKGKILLWIEK